MTTDEEGWVPCEWEHPRVMEIGSEEIHAEEEEGPGDHSPEATLLMIAAMDMCPPPCYECSKKVVCQHRAIACRDFHAYTQLRFEDKPLVYGEEEDRNPTVEGMYRTTTNARWREL
jgi:hypothetical protein